MDELTERQMAENYKNIIVENLKNLEQQVMQTNQQMKDLNAHLVECDKVLNKKEGNKKDE